MLILPMVLRFVGKKYIRFKTKSENDKFVFGWHFGYRVANLIIIILKVGYSSMQIICYFVLFMWKNQQLTFGLLYDLSSLIMQTEPSIRSPEFRQGQPICLPPNPCRRSVGLKSILSEQHDRRDRYRDSVGVGSNATDDQVFSDVPIHHAGSKEQTIPRAIGKSRAVRMGP